jgi:hypothetical protein
VTGRRGLRRLARSLAVLLATAATLAACGSDAPTPAASPTVSPDPTPTVTRYVMDRKVWYAGLVLTVEQAIATIDENGGPVVLSLHLENPGPAAATLGVPVRLTFADHGYEPRRGSEFPELDPGTAADVAITFDTGPGEDLAKAVVRIGRTEDHQALVPLAPGGVEAVALEPVAVDVKGKVRGGDLQLTVAGGVLRWDLPDWNEELRRASAVLTIDYSAVDVGSFEGGIPLTMDSVALQLPDGTEIAPRADGRSQSIAVLLPGATQSGLSTRFEIPAAARGTFTLIVRDGAGGVGRLKFTIGT